MLQSTTYWLFQAVNGLSALAMVAAPRRFHESMFRDPAAVYPALGFSPTAVEMLHNVLRGQGAALLAASLYLLALGPGARSGMLLIALVCGLALLAHVATLVHHRRSPVVMAALGSLGSMYGILALDLAVAAMALACYAR